MFTHCEYCVCDDVYVMIVQGREETHNTVAGN